METITGKATARTIMRNIEVDWELDEDGNVTVNGEHAGRVVESLPGRLFYVFPASGHDCNGMFESAAGAATSLASQHIR
ncbi:hypothetical protein [Paenarthrobacter ureafaciens]|uniref:hypothetical protein n=1 Tax=Paenarthrobacter ureafaciens TaxID=37931 RepID=UPI0015C0B869|nr:hypothetical protein [Paenarthrobacter ureafaciens]